MAEAVNTKQKHEQALQAMATPDFTNDLLAMLKIRAPLIYLTCNEEKRMCNYFKHLAAAKGYRICIWDCYLGLVNLISEKKEKATTDDIKDPENVLDKIIETAQLDEKNEQAMRSEGVNGNIYILLDFHRFLSDALPSTERRLKQFAKIESMTSIIVTGPFFKVTPTLEDSFVILDFPSPNKQEITGTLMSLVEAVKGKIPELSKDAEERQDELVKAANGLTINEAQMAFSKSVVKHKSLDIGTILKEKEQIIRKKGVLEYIQPKVSFKDVGGLKPLVNWFHSRKQAFRDDAAEYGLEAPRGAICIGMPGCVLGDTRIRVRKISPKGKHKIYRE
jgi:hypothetical protein